MVEENPTILEYDVVYSKYSEGNSYDDVYYSPSLGYYEDRGFKQTDYDENDEEIESEEINSICIN